MATVAQPFRLFSAENVKDVPPKTEKTYRKEEFAMLKKILAAIHTILWELVERIFRRTTLA